MFEYTKNIPNTLVFRLTLAVNIQKVPKQDILIPVGDWNAKIGLDAYKDWPGTIGKYGLGNTNDRGLRRLEFAKYQGLAVSNTFSPQKISRKSYLAFTRWENL